jgi:hypothetical protein
MRARPHASGPDPALLAALQAETETALRRSLEDVRAHAAALGEDPAPEAVAAVLKEAGALREKVEHDQRMGRLARDAARALLRETTAIGRGIQEQRRERARKRAEEREAQAARAAALLAAAQEFSAAVDAYDPLEKGREKADAVAASRQRFQDLDARDADPARARRAFGLFEDARRRLSVKYRERESVARENEALVDGLVRGFRFAVAELGPGPPREAVAHASAARRKVVDALRGVMLPREIRIRIQEAVRPADETFAEYQRSRRETWLRRQEERTKRDREFTAREARFLHYVAAFCSAAYSYDPTTAPRGEAAVVRQTRWPIDELLRTRACRPVRIRRYVDAARQAAHDFEARLEERRVHFVGAGKPHEVEEPRPPAALPDPSPPDGEGPELDASDAAEFAAAPPAAGDPGMPEQDPHSPSPNRGLQPAAASAPSAEPAGEPGPARSVDDGKESRP